MEFCEYLKDIDFFGKLPEFYIKGKQKQITLIGRIFTIIFIIIYILIFVYKIYRMFQRLDITFYDSYSDTEEYPSIEITNENFYLLFSLINESGQHFIDESIYYPKAFFIDEENYEIKLERCNIEKIGYKYKSMFQNSELINYYCLSKVNYTFISLTNSIKLQLFPCKNTTENNNHCKPKEIIDENINGKDFEINFEDIIITPLNFGTPIKEKINFIYTTVFKTFGQYLYTEMQFVNIETSTNIIGFDFLTKPKKEYFIKYNSIEIIPQPGYDLNDEANEYPICDVEFQLNDKKKKKKRQYIQLIDVLGEVGGLMEIIYSFFGVICSFVSDILYERIIANNLFSFDINRKIILIKKGKDLFFRTNADKNEEEKEKKVLNKIMPPTNKDKLKNVKLLIMDTMNKEEINDVNSGNNLVNKNIAIAKNSHNKDILENFDNYSDKNIYKYSDKNTKHTFYKRTNRSNLDLTNNNEKDCIINKINVTDTLISICICFKRKKGNLYKLLLNETMNIITEKLDIFNLFRDLYSIENSKHNNNSSNNLGIIRMSEECSNHLQDI